MDIYLNIAEYYEELYPVTESQKRFYAEEMQWFPRPVKLLRVGCGTGAFEHYLAREGADVTGLETSQELLESANRKRRTQLMSVRFFQMNTTEMGRFLGKGFYHIISVLDDRLMLIHDPLLIKRFFSDCKQLLARGGHLILSIPNFDKFTAEPLVQLPDRTSIRSSLYTQIWTDKSGRKFVQQDVETGSGRVLPVTKDVPIYPLTAEEIKAFAKEAGLSHCECYADFEETPFSATSDYLVARIF
ncbi:MAG: class I SAM-dependent methyltransferase [Treponema sp.]|nr:class I SAM-dependent methyltransferase [Treponema sp.]